MSIELEKLEIALDKIKDVIGSFEKNVLSRSELEQIFSENRDEWKLNKKTTVRTFIEFLISAGQLEEAKFDFPSRKESRYMSKKASRFELAQSLKPKAYLSHRSAMYLNGLINKIPEIIYINQEQPKQQPRGGGLTQESIDRAFSNNVRMSTDIAEYNGIKVCVLHGKKTGGLGVVEIKGKKAETLRVTSLERTLIDITVRSIHSGGASAVLEAYRLAKDNLSIDTLISTLIEMDYVYPYHQAVGFYLDKAEVYKKSDLESLQGMTMDFDFYLEYNMKDYKYSQEWRLYYPNDL